MEAARAEGRRRWPRRCADGGGRGGEAGTGGIRPRPRRRSRRCAWRRGEGGGEGDGGDGAAAESTRSAARESVALHRQGDRAERRPSRRWVAAATRWRVPPRGPPPRSPYPRWRCVNVVPIGRTPRLPTERARGRRRPQDRWGTAIQQRTRRRALAAAPRPSPVGNVENVGSVGRPGRSRLTLLGSQSAQGEPPPRRTSRPVAPPCSPSHFAAMPTTLPVCNVGRQDERTPAASSGPPTPAAAAEAKAAAARRQRRRRGRRRTRRRAVPLPWSPHPGTDLCRLRRRRKRRAPCGRAAPTLSRRAGFRRPIVQRRIEFDRPPPPAGARGRRPLDGRRVAVQRCRRRGPLAWRPVVCVGRAADDAHAGADEDTRPPLPRPRAPGRVRGPAGRAAAGRRHQGHHRLQDRVAPDDGREAV